MENSFFLRVEIILLFISLSYAIYYSIYSFRIFLVKWKRTSLETSKTRSEQLQNSTHINIWDNEDNYKKTEDNKVLLEDKMKIVEILRKEAIYYERGDFEKAKNLIIEWLAIDKFHKHLNLELANIYNKEWDYKKSEYIYRELIENQKEDFDLLKKLGFVLALQKKYKDSIRVYKGALEKKPNDPGIIDILSDLTYEIEDYEGTIKYACIYLKDKPRDIEKLQLQAFSLDQIWKDEEAIISYEKILEMQPYNDEIKGRIKRLEERNIEENS